MLNMDTYQASIIASDAKRLYDAMEEQFGSSDMAWQFVLAFYYNGAKTD